MNNVRNTLQEIEKRGANKWDYLVRPVRKNLQINSFFDRLIHILVCFLIKYREKPKVWIISNRKFEMNNRGKNDCDISPRDTLLHNFREFKISRIANLYPKSIAVRLVCHICM